MKPLPLDKSLELYKLLEPYFPEELDSEPFDFISIIVHNIRVSGNHMDFADAVAMMARKERKEILRMNTGDILDLFIDGLSENQIISRSAISY